MEIKNSLDSKIMVKAPYNILCELKKESDGSISAKVKNEFLLPDECGPIGAAEAGRHLSILGSIALSNTSDSENYYLAIQADIFRKTLSTNYVETFHLQSKVIFQDNRTGTVSGNIFDENNNVIYTINVKYQILRPSLFSKLFNSFANTIIIKNKINPYRNRKKLFDIIIVKDKISGVYGTVLSSECEGHFKDYPALPVAIICNSFTELGLKLFLHHYSNEFTKAVGTHANINANRLVFSGEYLTFRGETKRNNKSDKTMIFYFEALVNNKKVADAEFEICGIKNIDNNK